MSCACVSQPVSIAPPCQHTFSMFGLSHLAWHGIAQLEQLRAAWERFDVETSSLKGVAVE